VERNCDFGRRAGFGRVVWLAGLADQEDTQLANRARSVGGTSPERRVKGTGVEVILGRCRDQLGRPASVCIAAGVGRGRLETHGSARGVPGTAAANSCFFGHLTDCGRNVCGRDYPATEGSADPQ